MKISAILLPLLSLAFPSIGKEIGRGEYGYVREAWRNENPDEMFVVKFPSLRASAVSRMKSEIELLKHITNSNATNVVKLIESFENGSSEPVLVLERIGGGSIDEWIKKNRNRISSGQIQKALLYRLMKETALGVKQMHDLGICHRDIKVQ